MLDDKQQYCDKIKRYKIEIVNILSWNCNVFSRQTLFIESAIIWPYSNWLALDIISVSCQKREKCNEKLLSSTLVILSY